MMDFTIKDQITQFAVSVYITVKNAKPLTLDVLSVKVQIGRIISLIVIVKLDFMMTE
jgi:hypothetical protein